MGARTYADSGTTTFTNLGNPDSNATPELTLPEFALAEFGYASAESDGGYQSIAASLQYPKNYDKDTQAQLEVDFSFIAPVALTDGEYLYQYFTYADSSLSYSIGCDIIVGESTIYVQNYLGD